MLNDPFETLKKYINSPSGSHDKADVELTAAIIAEDFKALGFNVEVHPGKEYGPTLVCSIGSGSKTLMLMGHMDTVFPHVVYVPYTPQPDGKIKGSGIIDMKGGIMVMLYALKEALPKIDLNKYTIKAVLNPDEEAGSDESREYILGTAQTAFAALSFEPMGAGGRLTCARKGVTSVFIECTGVPGHAGAEYTKCHSAIEALCKQLSKLYTLRDDSREISFNAGLISGGTAENVVAPYASCKCEVRYFNMAYREPLLSKIKELTSEEPVPGAHTKVTFGPSHPAVDDTPASLALAQKAIAIGKTQGRSLFSEKTGGAGDISIAAQTGVPVLDGLGLYGGSYHTIDEYCLKEAVPNQIELAQKLISELC